MDSSSKDKHQKEKKPRQTSIRDYYKTTKSYHGCIEKRLDEMESKVFQLEKAKLSLQVEVNILKKENSELKKKLASSEIPPKTPMAKTGTSQQRKTFDQQAYSKKEHQQIQQDKISKTRQVKITAEPKASRNKPLIIIAGDSLLKYINGWLMSPWVLGSFNFRLFHYPFRLYCLLEAINHV